MTTTVRLRDVGATYGGLTGKTKTDFGRGDATFVTFLEVINNTRLRGRALERVRVAKGERQSRVMRGDLIFNGSSETPEEVALSAVVDFDPDASTYLNSFCFGFRLRPGSEVDPTYLAYLFRSSVGRSLVASLAQGATRYNIAKTKFLDVQLALPSVDRQREIVETLGDTDDLIGALKRKIAKQQAIKQGMMQQLLTGRRRLHGFTGEWAMAPLGEIAVVTMGQSPAGSTYNTDGVGLPLVQGNADIRDRRTYDRVWTSQPTKRCRAGEVLLTVRAPVGLTAVASKDACLGRGVCSLTCEGSNRFLFHALVHAEPRWKIFEQGSTFTSVNSNEVRGFVVSWPSSRAERAAIAEALDDADLEISMLRRRLTKAKHVKEGMMQALLTGRTRLKVAEGAA